MVSTHYYKFMAPLLRTNEPLLLCSNGSITTCYYCSNGFITTHYLGQQQVAMGSLLPITYPLNLQMWSELARVPASQVQRPAWVTDARVKHC